MWAANNIIICTLMCSKEMDPGSCVSAIYFLCEGLRMAVKILHFRNSLLRNILEAASSGLENMDIRAYLKILYATCGSVVG